MFIVNTILSGFVVYEYYLDSQTTSTYITNILFMVTKLADVYANVNTEKNVFYSAYMKGKIQYNDVDPNKIVSPLPVSSSELLENGEYNVVPGITPPVEEDKEEKEDKEEETKIIVTIHDINSPKSSSNDLQSFNENQ
jgi:hypothetical protein